jgi:hypothetical protein
LIAVVVDSETAPAAEPDSDDGPPIEPSGPHKKFRIEDIPFTGLSQRTEDLKTWRESFNPTLYTWAGSRTTGWNYKPEDQVLAVAHIFDRAYPHLTRFTRNGHRAWPVIEACVSRRVSYTRTVSDLFQATAALTNWRSALGKAGRTALDIVWQEELVRNPIDIDTPPRPADSALLSKEEQLAVSGARAAAAASAKLQWADAQLEGNRFNYKYPDAPVRQSTYPSELY